MTELGPAEAFNVLRAQYDNMLNCIRCGQCLPACPTYRISYAEEEGPRGRIAIARALVEGHLDLTEDLMVHEGNCLLCEACTAVCPAGVQMEPIGVAMRSVIAAAESKDTNKRIGQAILFDWAFSNMGRFRRLCSLARLYQRSPLSSMLRRSGLLRLLRLADVEALLPSMNRVFFVSKGQAIEPVGELAGEAGVFAGCIMSTAFSETDRATARVLAANGYRAVACAGQGCCGALHVHGGRLDKARALARANVEAFQALERDTPIIVNAAGCGSTLKGYGHLLAGDPAYAEQAARFAARVKDVSEFLADLPLRRPEHAVDRTVTLQEPCHLAHAQRIREAPRKVLNAIPGLRLVEMNEPALCCGSAGIYNVTHPLQARELLGRKLQNIEEAGADTVVTANPGCLLQIDAGLRAAGSAIRICHIVDLLDQAYGGPSTETAY